MSKNAAMRYENNGELSSRLLQRDIPGLNSTTIRPFPVPPVSTGMKSSLLPHDCRNVFDLLEMFVARNHYQVVLLGKRTDPDVILRYRMIFSKELSLDHTIFSSGNLVNPPARLSRL